MRNKFAGTCYRCKLRVEPGAGHFERHGNGWRVQHAECAIEFRGRPMTEDGSRPMTEDEATAALLAADIEWASQSGKRAQQARKRLREQGVSW